MSKLDDLHTLVRLLREFEFPVSPILEYAIKEKEEELYAECPTVVEEDSYIKEQSESVVVTESISFTSLKEEFSNYLYKTKSELTARNYLRYIEKPIRAYISRAIGSDVDSLYFCKTVPEVRALLLRLKADESFVADNLKWLNALTAAINSYLKFLEGKKTYNSYL